MSKNLLENIYLRAPFFIKQAAIGIYGRNLKRLRYGGNVPGDYTLGFLFGKKRGWLDHYQLDRLNEIMKIAEGVPFYRKMTSVDKLSDLKQLSSLPILTKADIQQSGGALVNRSLSKKQMVTGHTSGSTGTPLVYYHSVFSIRKMFSLYNSFKQWHGIMPHARRVRFGGRMIIPYSRKKPPFWLKDKANNTLYLSLLHMAEQNMEAYIDAITDFDAREFSGYPSSLYLLAEYCLRHGIDKLRPYRVITDSETLLEYQREAISKAFDCRVIDFYGISETEGMVAGECPKGNYHIFPQVSYIEILDEEGKALPPGQTGIIHITSLTNDCMPFIRYNTGDLAAISEEHCSCGLQTRLLKNIEGRTDDTITTSDGRKIGRLDHIFKQGSDIREAQIVQEKAGAFTFKIVPGRHFIEKSIEVIRKQAYARLGETAHITFELVDAIPRTSRGKFKSVVVK